MKRFLSGTAVLISAVSANAADLATKAPVYKAAPAAPTWTGAYVGADLGWSGSSSAGSWNPTEFNLNQAPSAASNVSFGEFPIHSGSSGSGISGGFHAGYNWQFAPSWVTGIEADWDVVDAASSFSQPWTSTDPVAHPGLVRPGTLTTVTSDPQWLASVRARFGYLVTPSALLYATGGAAFGSVTNSASASNEPTQPPTARYNAVTSSTSTASGWVVGGGLEYGLGSGWSVRGEYLYYRLSSAGSANAADANGNFVPGGPNPGHWNSAFSFDDLTVQTVRAGLSYKF